VVRHWLLSTPCASSRRSSGYWHIARLPGGRIALALQYGHLRTTVSSGYSNRARHGLRRVLDIETARAIADYLQQLDQRLDRGEGVSGVGTRYDRRDRKVSYTCQVKDSARTAQCRTMRRLLWTMW
jgi:hypothetical protein